MAHVALLVGGAVAVGAVAERGPRTLVTAAATWAVLGGRSLDREAAAVADLLAAGRLDERARAADPPGRPRHHAGSTRREVARAAIESLAENTSDAVVAPLRAGARWPGVPGLLGLPRRQHAGRDGRPPQPALRALRLGRRPARRPAQPARLAPDGRARDPARRRSRRRPAGLATGRRPAPEPERRAGRGGVRGRAGGPARRHQRVRRPRRAPARARRRAAAGSARHLPRPSSWRVGSARAAAVVAVLIALRPSRRRRRRR